LESKKWELEWQLKGRRVELADKETVERYVQELRNLLNESSLAERKPFIKSFVKNITVTGNEVTLIYTPPLPQDSLTEEKLAVPRIVHYGGRYWI
jgi:site-specific DNA recombinase